MAQQSETGSDKKTAGKVTTELSIYCKENCGLNAKEVADLAEVPRRTFYDWWIYRRKAVELIIDGINSRRKNDATKP